MPPAVLPPHLAAAARRRRLRPSPLTRSFTRLLCSQPRLKPPPMEDVWGDGSSGDEREGLDREWRARREEHWSSGYREGLEAGKHETVQQGFNEGGMGFANRA